MPPTAKVRLNGSTAIYSPQFLPAGRGERLLIAGLGSRNTQSIVKVDLKAGAIETLFEGAYPVYSPSGHILYMRYPREPGILAVPFTPGVWKPSGQPVPIIADGGDVTVSGDGSLVWTGQYSQPKLKFSLYTTEGKPIPSPVVSNYNFRGYAYCRLSPDGTRVLYMLTNRGGTELWMMDLSNRIPSRLASDSRAILSPIWSPDGKEVAFALSAGSNRKTQLLALETGKTLATLPNGGTPTSWSPDGKTLLVAGRPDIYTVTRNPDGSFGNSKPFLVSPFAKARSEISPDGRFVLYNSDESGTWQLYVAAYPSGSGKRQVTAGGPSTAGLWSPDGKSIYFASESAIHRVPISSAGDALTIGVSSKVLDLRVTDVIEQSLRPFALAPDGKRILVLEPIDNSGRETPSIHIVLNWTALLKRQGLAPE